MIIIPALLSDSIETIQTQLARVVGESNLRRVQIDIVDALFADEITVFPSDLADIDFKGLAVDIHLMTDDPANDIVECTYIPGIHAIIGQVEHMSSQDEFLREVIGYGLVPGLSLDLNTPIDAIEEESFTKLKIVQVMGIKAGAQGQVFAGQKVLDKVTSLRALYPELEILVDGGVKVGNVSEIREVSPSGVVVGSALWESQDFAGTIAKLGQNA